MDLDNTDISDISIGHFGHICIFDISYISISNILAKHLIGQILAKSEIAVANM
jgi:hypothetical protein